MEAKVARATLDAASPQAVQAGGAVQFPSFASNTRCVSYDGSGGVAVKSTGTYAILATATVVATDATQAVELQLFEDGAAVAGARASTVLQAEGDSGSLAMMAVSTVSGAQCGSTATITLRAVGGASVSAAQLVVLEV